MKSSYKHMKCGLIGEHLGHSFSPQIHRELADYSYDLFELSPEAVGDFVKNSPLNAFNVTIPYKKTVIPFLDEISPEAETIGAVNTIVKRDGRIYGYNTDYFGFDYMVRSSGIDVKGKKAIVFGTGGAAATVFAVLRDMAVSELIPIGIENNTPENIAKHKDAEIVVNATPVGMFPKNGAAPISLDAFPKCILVLDVIYNPARTALLLDAERRGIAAVNGLPMLVAQAAKAFEFFTGDSCEYGAIERIISDIGKETRNIILVGMPGCGKSRVGKKLAEKLGRDFYDADDEFTKMHGLTPAEAITSLGEQEFREMEHKTLEEICKLSGAVISTGGGAVTKEYNYPTLHQNGTVIFLERKLENLSTKGRPLSQSTSVYELYEKRKNSYIAFSDIRIMSTEVIELTVQKMIEALDSYNYTCIFR